MYRHQIHAENKPAARFDHVVHSLMQPGRRPSPMLRDLSDNAFQHDMSTLGHQARRTACKYQGCRPNAGTQSFPGHHKALPTLNTCNACAILRCILHLPIVLATACAPPPTHSMSPYDLPTCFVRLPLPPLWPCGASFAPPSLHSFTSPSKFFITLVMWGGTPGTGNIHRHKLDINMT